ncbi:deoxynucleotide monophosphate kinase [Bradyrhizobium sp. SZCCHNR1004]|uniref:deoxynucleotide monophosphate kinase n=1 Tax=Bradyrhizobium sp. SZCCHNR1004 TaxID=3057335 RepID=UPI0029169B3A|nr:deoxynucleotide monophosphate kinase [Bradyrhizobium sp. SZCCHNR1004]
MIVIGIKGFIGAGKTTAARYLIENHGFVRGRFAGALKDMLRAYLIYRGCTPAMGERMIEGDLKDKPTAWLGGRSPRYAMEGLGGAWGRDYMGADFWIDTEADKLSAESPTRVVVEDVRHGNEGEWIDATGGMVIEIVRPGLVPQDHRTEYAQLDVKARRQICNYDGGLASTYRQIDIVVQDLVAKNATIGLPPMQTQPVR